MQQNPFNRPTNQPDSYKTLIVFRKSECVYDITFYFVSRFLERSHDRTVDQMQQAARSGKQNIVEGYSDAEGSTDTTFYILAVYFGSVGIRYTRHAVACGLLADLAGVIAAIAICYMFF